MSFDASTEFVRSIGWVEDAWTELEMSGVVVGGEVDMGGADEVTSVILFEWSSSCGEKKCDRRTE
jgi:hypothetical protein